MWPERFLRKCYELFPGVPVVLFALHGFRLNQRVQSKRRNWLLDKPIDSIMSLTVDAFQRANIHVEVLCFNLRCLQAHYWLPLPGTDPTPSFDLRDRRTQDGDRSQGQLRRAEVQTH